MLTLKDVNKVYLTEAEAVQAVSSVSLNVESGEFVSFIGPSGCGKTTVLSIIAGLLRPTSGDIVLHDKEITGPTEETGYMLQEDYLFPWLTIQKNIELGLMITNLYNEKTKNDALRLLQELGLGDKAQAFPSELSGGMRQRAALVRMLAPKPSLLLLDEPFSALDYQTKLKLEDLVFSTLKQQKKTAILVTHDLSEAIAMSDRIYLFQSRPGSIHHVFDVPDELREKLPLEARNDPAFHPFFQTVWKELEKVENKHSNTS
ncbi:NitT/TauT family transport system ATP-binding protein [Alteribacillus persepolensis]|uniref:NitT/TauT family transport system ATP-binding protein n=1 Tax=Alteribacillus persepolensis TaxID=568899 RepID=A0A1G8E229_9BACI|nr:ABC transporter ATP-binding protein [Alteribacillus persepolensis]SDH63977.1 NitT/TauT family transport system ATP-binding protein [Alteribacillus persepolensis]